MTQGYPLISARRSRRPDPFAPSSYVMSTAGSEVLAGIAFGADEATTFQNLRGVGHFLCVFQSQTKQQDLKIEVLEPAEAETAWNVVEAKRMEWDQIISVPVTQSGPRGSVMTFGTPNTQRRGLVCNTNVQLPFLVRLTEGQTCVLGVTGAANRSWDFFVCRMLPEGVNLPFVEHPNVLFASGIGDLTTTGWTILRVTSIGRTILNSELINFYRVTKTGPTPTTINWAIWHVNNTFAHRTVLRVRKSAIAAGGGQIRIRLLDGAATELLNELVTIPSDASVVELVYNAAISGPATYSLWLDDLANGDQCEIGVGCLVLY